MDKKHLRDHAKKIRAGFSDEQREEDSKLLRENIIVATASRLRGKGKNGVVGTYHPIGTEIIPPIAIPNAQMALPVIRNKTTLEFYPWSPDMRLVKRDFDIPIPDTRGLSPVTPDILLMPLLLCDKHGNRIGYGAGHYDRYIASCETKPYLIGVCFDEQIYDGDIPSESHDMPLDLIVTPRRTITPLHKGEGNETLKL